MTKLITSKPDWALDHFFAQADLIAQQLTQTQTSVVALWFEDGAKFACALLGCLQANARILLPPNQLPENQTWLVEQQAFVLSDQNFEQFVQPNFPLSKKLSAKKVENFPPHFWQSQSEIWLKTSGSTGEAKVIVKTAKQMWCEAETLAKRLDFADNLQVIGSVTVQHLYGLTFRVMLPLYQILTGKNWQIGRFQHHYAEFLLAESKQPSLWICSPTLLNNINFAYQGLEQLAMKGIISSGGMLPESTAHKLRQHFPCLLTEIYGSTETGVIAYRFDYQDWHPFDQVRLGKNSENQLWVESPWANGRQQTADLIEQNAQGFQLLGRADRIIKLNEKRISLLKLEQNLLKHPWVADCYLGLHPQRQRLVAWVALQQDPLSIERKALISELKNHLSQFEERLALPRFWRFCSALPRNSQGKLSLRDFEKICDEIN